MLSGFVLVAALRVPWRATVEVVSLANPLWLFASVAANAVILIWVTLQWRLFLPRGARVSLETLFSVTGLTATVSNTAPMVLGYAAAMQLLKSRAGLTSASAAAVLVLEQMADAIAKAAIAGVAVALMPALEYRTAGLLLVVVLAVAAVGLALLTTRQHLLEAWAVRTWRPLAKAVRALARALTHLDALQRPGHFSAGIALGIAKRGMEALGVYAAATALGVSLPLWALLAAPIATNLALSFSATPAGLGVYEGVSFLIFRAAGVDTAAAVALGFLAHVTLLVPQVGFGWMLESGRMARRVDRRSALMLAIALLGIGIHLWFALGGDAANSDAALVILMARHFASGEWALYFWQQNWMANLEPLLLTPLAVADLATPLTAGLVGIGLSAALAALSVGLARRLGGVSWVTLLVWAVPPALVAHHHVALYGARLAATLMVLLAFSLSVGAASRRAWVGVGILTGLAFFGDHLMIAWVAGVMFVAVRRGSLREFAIGAIPVVVLDAYAATMTPAFHLVGPNYPSDWLLNVSLLLGTVVPQLTGLLLGRGPGPEWMLPTSIVPDAVWWPFIAIPGAICLTLLYATLIRHREQTFGASADERGVPAQALVVVTVIQLGLFILVGGRGETWSVRYLVPLWPAISVFLAIAAGHWRPSLRPLAALAVLPGAVTLWVDETWPRGDDAAPARVEAEAVRQRVASAGVQAVWADYWDTYRMALLIGETPRWVTFSVIERRLDWAREARDARPVAYLVRQGDKEMLAALEAASVQGIHRISDDVVGRFRFIVLASSVPGLEFRNPTPSRKKQVVAALSADLLFVGALAVIGLLPAIRSRAGVDPTHRIPLRE